MAINITSFLKVQLAITLLLIIAETQFTEANDKSYLKKACNKTLYSTQCFNSLSPYSARIKSNPFNLCRYAAKVATYYAAFAKSDAKSMELTKGLTNAELAVAKDCVETIGDAADDLRQSYRGLTQLDNATTWASSALTNYGTCTDGMEEMEVGPGKMGKLKVSVVKAARSTSVLLAFMKDNCTS